MLAAEIAEFNDSGLLFVKFGKAVQAWSNATKSTSRSSIATDTFVRAVDFHHAAGFEAISVYRVIHQNASRIIFCCEPKNGHGFAS